MATIAETNISPNLREKTCRLLIQTLGNLSGETHERRRPI